jgi:hypothetical protein
MKYNVVKKNIVEDSSELYDVENTCSSKTFMRKLIEESSSFTDKERLRVKRTYKLKNISDLKDDEEYLYGCVSKIFEEYPDLVAYPIHLKKSDKVLTRLKRLTEEMAVAVVALEHKFGENLRSKLFTGVIDPSFLNDEKKLNKITYYFTQRIFNKMEKKAIVLKNNLPEQELKELEEIDGLKVSTYISSKELTDDGIGHIHILFVYDARREKSMLSDQTLLNLWKFGSADIRDVWDFRGAAMYLAKPQTKTNIINISPYTKVINYGKFDEDIKDLMTWYKSPKYVKDVFKVPQKIKRVKIKGKSYWHNPDDDKGILVRSPYSVVFVGGELFLVNRGWVSGTLLWKQTLTPLTFGEAVQYNMDNKSRLDIELKLFGKNLPKIRNVYSYMNKLSFNPYVYKNRKRYRSKLTAGVCHG